MAKQKIWAWNKDNSKQYPLEIDYATQHLEFDINGIPFVKNNIESPVDNTNREWDSYLSDIVPASPATFF